MKKLRVGILGATGSVGQRFISLLAHHPWFSVTALVASEKSAEKLYKDAVNWKMDQPIPYNIASLMVHDVHSTIACDFVFSGLDSSIAGIVEDAFAKAGYPVITNSKNHRMDDDVPLLIPEINPDHIDMLFVQKRRRKYTTGFIVANPNCSAVGLSMVLKPLHDAFRIQKVHVVTMQALSGAGFPGVASMDIMDNVIPYINDEEEKLEIEPRKILGSVQKSQFISASFIISAQCNRVPVTDGHTEAVSIQFQKKPTVEQVIRALIEFRGIPQSLALPSAPREPIVVLAQENRPQPRLDRSLGNGMSVSVGRVRKCSLYDIKFVLLSHNTIRGAAGAAILNAELLYKKGLLPKLKKIEEQSIRLSDSETDNKEKEACNC